MLGFFWSLILPLAQVATLTFVFRYLFDNKIPNFSAYLFCSILPFNFFSQSVLEASNSILTYGGLIKKTYFPREVIPASIVISNFVHFFLALIVFFLYLGVLRIMGHFADPPVYGHPPVMVTWLLAIPVMLVIFALTMGISFFLVCLNTYYEDVKYLTTVVMNLLFYAMPILYPIEFALLVPHHRLGLLLKLHFLGNPLAYLIVTFRKILLEPMAPIDRGGGFMVYSRPLDYHFVALAALTSIIVFFAGYAFFNKRKWNFAERL